MPPITDAQIAEIAAQLEAEAAQSPAHFVGKIDGGGADESHGEGNRSGYLRAAAILLRAAILPEGQSLISDDENPLFDSNSDIFLSHLSRNEDWPEEPEPRCELTRWDRFWNAVFAYGCLFVFVNLLILFLAGVIAGWESIF